MFNIHSGHRREKTHHWSCFITANDMNEIISVFEFCKKYNNFGITKHKIKKSNLDMGSIGNEIHIRISQDVKSLFRRY